MYGLMLTASFVVQGAQLLTPGAAQRLEQDRLDREKQEMKLQKSTPVAPEIIIPDRGAGKDVDSDIKNIPVTQFDVNASEFLTIAEIKMILEPYKGRNVSLNELFEVVAELNKLYGEKNIKTARAILPAQEIKEGVVKISLIEAYLGQIRIKGQNHLRPSFVEDRIHQQAGDLVSITELERDLIRFNSLYEPKLRAGVVAGAEVGKTDITIEVQEPKRYALTSFADNAGSYTVGQARIGTLFQATNLIGINDKLQFNATGTEGSRSYGFNYSIPVSKMDTILDLSYNKGSVEVVNGAFVPLDITGRSRNFTVGLTQPFAVGINRQWATYGRFSSRDSISEFSGFTQQDLNLKVIVIGLTAEAHYDDYAWTLDNSFNFGTTSFGGDEKFTYYRANASRIDRLTDRLQLLTRAGLQYSFNDIIPSGEQFQVGGIYSVRGFSEGLISGRKGYFGSIELRGRLSSRSSTVTTGLSPLVQALGFFDHGVAFPYRPGQGHSEDDYLTSAGVGLMLDFGNWASLKLTLAYPLDNNPNEVRQRNSKLLSSVNITWL
ncbi:MAG: hemolysin activation/secretion protein [Oleiphilaceae bacterium]|jgi:hemolysin activation/secretion protein